MAVFPTVVHSEVKRGPLLHTAEAGYLSLQQRGNLWDGESCLDAYLQADRKVTVSYCK